MSATLTSGPLFECRHHIPSLAQNAPKGGRRVARRGAPVTARGL